MVPRWLIYTAIAALALLNAHLVVDLIRFKLAGGESGDFETMQHAAILANPFDYEVWRWSPVAAWFTPALVALGLPLLTALKFVVLPLLGWRLGLLIAVSYPFWFDVAAGNVMTFVLVAAWFAWHGHRSAMIAFFALALLMPRPIMAPLTVWLLWREPWTRVPFAALFASHAVMVLGSGYAGDWMARLLSSSGEMSHPLNWGPSRWIGVAWLPIGLALAAWLTWKEQVGLASLAVSPYILPYYWLFGLLELQRPVTNLMRTSMVRSSSCRYSPISLTAGRRKAH